MHAELSSNIAEQALRGITDISEQEFSELKGDALAYLNGE